MNDDLRDQLMHEILAQRVPCTKRFHDAYPRPSCLQCARNGAFVRAARIVLTVSREVSA